MKPIAEFDWPGIEADLDREGHALLPQLLAADEARRLAAHVAMAADAGSGLWAAPEAADRLEQELGPLLAACSRMFSQRLVATASRWRARMEAGQAESDLGAPQPITLSARTSLLSAGEFEPLQHADADPRAFPLQLVVLLSEAARDFTGGEFVMTEQRPRMQSRPMVAPLGLGDGVLVAAGHRPVEGRHGYYRATTRHAISRVRSGSRIGLEILPAPCAAPLP